jgi:hypothetical protein
MFPHALQPSWELSCVSHSKKAPRATQANVKVSLNEVAGILCHLVNVRIEHSLELQSLDVLDREDSHSR